MKSTIEIPTEAIQHLSEADKQLRFAIETVGKIEREKSEDLFSSIIASIVSQMISAKAAETIWSRIETLLGEVTPLTVCNTPTETIQKCGISMRKALHIKEAAKMVNEGSFDIEALRSMEDDKAIASLCTLKGIGKWTAEMILIFTLGRMDILSWDDLAIRRGLCRLHSLSILTKEAFAEYKRRYSPYCSIASLYIWEISHLSDNHEFFNSRTSQ